MFVFGSASAAHVANAQAAIPARAALIVLIVSLPHLRGRAAYVPQTKVGIYVLFAFSRRAEGLDWFTQSVNSSLSGSHAVGSADAFCSLQRKSTAKAGRRAGLDAGLARIVRLCGR